MIRNVAFVLGQQSKIFIRGAHRAANSKQSRFLTQKSIQLPILTGVAFGSYIVYRSTQAYTVDAAEDYQNESKWTLYQYATCPFCCKVRSFLDYYGVDYEIVEVNPVTRKEIKFSEYRKVPFLTSKEHQLNDSSLICSVLKTQLITESEVTKILTYYPILENEDGKKKSFDYQNRYNVMYETGLGKEAHDKVRDEMKWRRWVDEVFVHTLSPNIYRTWGESLQAMEYITKVGNFSDFERTLIYYSGAVAMYLIGKRLKHRHHLRNEVRESLYEETYRWLKAVGKNPYQGGDQPNMADLNMYGVLSAIEGYDAFSDLLQNTNIGPWYQRMKTKVKNKDGIQEVQRLKALVNDNK